MPISTRMASFPRACMRRSAAYELACSSVSTPVTPRLSASACASATASSHSASVTAGAARSASSFARSCSTPVGRPRSSRKIAPPSGTGVRSSMPAPRSAAVFSHRAWPSRLRSTVGRSPVARSRSAAVGQRPQRFLSNRPPVSHRPGSSAAARVATTVSASSTVFALRKSTSRIWKPHHMRWTCASNQPGTMSPPRRSTRSAPLASRPSSEARPTAATRPSRARSASADCPPRTRTRPPWNRIALTDRDAEGERESRSRRRRSRREAGASPQRHELDRPVAHLGAVAGPHDDLLKVLITDRRDDPSLQCALAGELR